MVCVKFTAFCDLQAAWRIRQWPPQVGPCKSSGFSCKRALTCESVWPELYFFWSLRTQNKRKWTLEQLRWRALERNVSIGFLLKTFCPSAMTSAQLSLDLERCLTHHHFSLLTSLVCVREMFEIFIALFVFRCSLAFPDVTHLKKLFKTQMWSGSSEVHLMGSICARALEVLFFTDTWSC